MSVPHRKIRILGGLLLATGLFLSGAMGWLIWWLTDVVGNPGSSGRWNGGPIFTAATFRLFYSVLFFGVASQATGLFQLATGRRSTLILTSMVLTFAWLAYCLWMIQSLKSTL